MSESMLGRQKGPFNPESEKSLSPDGIRSETGSRAGGHRPRLQVARHVPVGAARRLSVRNGQPDPCKRCFELSSGNEANPLGPALKPASIRSL